MRDFGWLKNLNMFVLANILFVFVFDEQVNPVKQNTNMFKLLYQTFAHGEIKLK